MGNLIHFPCWMDLLIRYKDAESVPTISVLSKQMGITYSHAVNVIKSLSQTGLILTEKNGRTNKVKVTVDGRKVGQMFALSKRIVSEGGAKYGFKLEDDCCKR